MAKRGRSREKARREHVRREAEAAKALRDAMLHGTGFMRGGRHVEIKDMLRNVTKAASLSELRVGAPDKYLSADALRLKDSLRNVSRTATRSLDEAGVPEHLQGAAPEDWEDFE
ncbi:MAG: hypothetical protein WCY29_05925 [Novosphingobium sp.]